MKTIPTKQKLISFLVVLSTMNKFKDKNNKEKLKRLFIVDPNTSEPNYAATIIRAEECVVDKTNLGGSQSSKPTFLTGLIDQVKK